jgi:hypothetical protein
MACSVRFNSCFHTFASCLNAPCVKKGSIIECYCDVYKGLSIGTRPCRRLLPFKRNGVQYVFSTYTGKTLPESVVVRCDRGGPRGDCLNRICKVDPTNPKKAICYCLPIAQTPYVIFPLRSSFPKNANCNLCSGYVNAVFHRIEAFYKAQLYKIHHSG